MAGRGAGAQRPNISVETLDNRFQRLANKLGWLGNETMSQEPKPGGRRTKARTKVKKGIRCDNTLENSDKENTIEKSVNPRCSPPAEGLADKLDTTESSSSFVSSQGSMSLISTQPKAVKKTKKTSKKKGALSKKFSDILTFSSEEDEAQPETKPRTSDTKGASSTFKKQTGEVKKKSKHGSAVFTQQKTESPSLDDNVVAESQGPSEDKEVLRSTSQSQSLNLYLSQTTNSTTSSHDDHNLHQTETSSICSNVSSNVSAMSSFTSNTSGQSWVSTCTSVSNTSGQLSVSTCTSASNTSGKSLKPRKKKKAKKAQMKILEAIDFSSDSDSEKKSSSKDKNDVKTKFGISNRNETEGDKNSETSGHTVSGICVPDTQTEDTQDKTSSCFGEASVSGAVIPDSEDVHRESCQDNDILSETQGSENLGRSHYVTAVAMPDVSVPNSEEDDNGAPVSMESSVPKNTVPETQDHCNGIDMVVRSSLSNDNIPKTQEDEDSVGFSVSSSVPGGIVPETQDCEDGPETSIEAQVTNHSVAENQEFQDSQKVTVVSSVSNNTVPEMQVADNQEVTGGSFVPNHTVPETQSENDQEVTVGSSMPDSTVPETQNISGDDVVPHVENEQQNDHEHVTGKSCDSEHTATSSADSVTFSKNEQQKSKKPTKPESGTGRLSTTRKTAKEKTYKTKKKKVPTATLR